MDILYDASDRRPNSPALNEKENLLACFNEKYKGNVASGKVSSSSSKEATENLVSFCPSPLSSAPSLALLLGVVDAEGAASLSLVQTAALIPPAVGRVGG